MHAELARGFGDVEVGGGQGLVDAFPLQCLDRGLARAELDLGIACGAGECGACTIIMDGQAVNACLVLAPEANGKVITTVEGLAHGDELTPLQESFIDHAALQCGFCTPGMLMSAEAMLRENPHPTREQINRNMSGNLCRCTGYKKIVEAIEDVIAKGVYEK